MRNLDITMLRSYVAVADMGGVTRAARHLHLTQSAVSMQLKRLEEVLETSLLDRSNRAIAFTPVGEQFLSYARRMVALNDEAVAKLTHEGELTEIPLGVPHDIVYPFIPEILQKFHAEFPDVRVRLATTFTHDLKARFERGECSIILTTEQDLDAGGETLCELPLHWVGAPGGKAWRHQPLSLAQTSFCLFRSQVIAALERAEIGWVNAMETDSERTVETMISADLGVQAMLEGTIPAHLERIEHGGALPELPSHKINLYGGDRKQGAAENRLLEFLREAFARLQVSLAA